VLQAFDEIANRLVERAAQRVRRVHHHVVQQPFDGRDDLLVDLVVQLPAAPTTVSPRERARGSAPDYSGRVRRQLHGRIEQLFLAVVRERERQRLAEPPARRGTCGRGCGRPG